MKTPDEIKDGLERCQLNEERSIPNCKYCPYEFDPNAQCDLVLHADALAYIEQLEERLAQVERERDAAVSELASNCRACRFIVDDSHCEDCFQRVGKHPWSPIVRTKFEWRGICAENTKEDTRE